MHTLDLNDPKIALIHDALQNVLAKHDVTKISDYFTDDAIIIINEKKLEGKEQIAKRLVWIKNNAPAVKIVLQNAFFSGNEGFDHHTSELIEKDGKKIIFKVFGYIVIRDNKIARYEDLTIQLEGNDAMYVATSSE